MRGLYGLLLLAAPLAFSGCAMGAVVARPTPTTRPAPTATPTPGFSVAITAVPTPQPKPTPDPTATPFHPPGGPYIALSSTSGPPLARTVTVFGGNLPKNAQVQLSWTPSRTGSPLRTSASTDGHGSLSTRFSIPASQPGGYEMVAQIQGQTIASTRYTVSSRAALFASASPDAKGDLIQVRGVSFIPHMKLALIAYPMFHGAKVVLLGRVHSGQLGSFAFSHSTSQLEPGEYLLRAWSTSGLAAQMADTFFQVTV